MIKCAELDLALLLDEDESCFQSGGDREALALHVEACAACQQRLAQLAADEFQWQEACTCLAPEDGAAGEWAESHGARAPWKRPTVWTQSMATSLLSPPVHPEMLGRLGRYDIECLIGSGGMGVVFKAHDTELNRPVAIKMLAPHLAENGPARQRFAREGRAAAAVVDDHVVPIHNVDASGDRGPFLVMQYVAGGSLQQRLDRDGALSTEETLRIGMQTAKGLAAAHAQGLIHRDVKPSNILLDEGVERALLTDFGLARTEDDACLTRSGFHPGTPHYMSPEQVRGEEIDHRSDLFSLGCVLYALCTGRPPFRAETSYAVMRRITDDTPRPIREINPAIPEWMEQIVFALLAKSPGARLGSAADVAQLLESCLSHVQQPTTRRLPESVSTLPLPLPAGGKQKRTWRRLLTSAVVGLVLSLAATMVVLELNKGTLTIETSEPDVPIRILKDGAEYTSLHVTAGAKSIRIAAGQYLVEIDGDAHELTVDASSVTITRGDEQIVRVTHQPRPTDAPDALAERSETGPTGTDTPPGSAASREQHSIILPDQTLVESAGSADALVAATIQLVTSATIEGQDAETRIPQPNTTLILSPPQNLRWSLGGREQSIKARQIIVGNDRTWGPHQILVRVDGHYRKFAKYSPQAWIGFRCALARLQYRRSEKGASPESRRKTRFSFANIEASALVEILTQLFSSQPAVDISLDRDANELQVSYPESLHVVVRQSLTAIDGGQELTPPLPDAEMQIAGETQQQSNQGPADFSQRLDGTWHLLSTQLNANSEPFDSGEMVATIRDQTLQIRSLKEKSRSVHQRFRIVSAERIDFLEEDGGREVRKLGRYRLMGEWLWVAVNDEPADIASDPPVEAMPAAPAKDVRYMMFHRAPATIDAQRTSASPPVDHQNKAVVAASTPPDSPSELRILERKLRSRPVIWRNGIYPEMSLPENADVNDVLAAACKRFGYEQGERPAYRLLDTLELDLGAGDVGYSAALVKIEQDRKILVYKYLGNQQWWTRFYAAPITADGLSDEHGRPSQGDGDLHWGASSNGIQIRVRPCVPEEIRSDSVHDPAVDRAPRFFVDLRNNSGRGRTEPETLPYVAHPSSCEIEVDGIWYERHDAVLKRSLSELLPGRNAMAAIAINLTGPSGQKWVSQADGTHLVMAQGRHKLRASMARVGGDDAEKLVSNAVWFEVAPVANVDRRQSREANSIYRAIHIGFAFDPGRGNYDGVVGAPDDIWNFVDLGTTAVDYMRHADGSGSSARLRMTRFDGEWAVKTENQVFRGYIYHNCQCVDLEATLLDVAPGRYQLFVYAHGNAPDQNANVELVVGDRSLGKKATSKENSPAFRSAKLQEGLQYVTFDVDVKAGETIRIVSHRDGSGYSMFNAIQLVPVEKGVLGSGQVLPVMSFTGTDSQLSVPQRLRITDQERWQRIWSKHTGDGQPRDKFSPPHVDFANHMVIGLVEAPDQFAPSHEIEVYRAAVAPGDQQAAQTMEFVTIDYQAPLRAQRVDMAPVNVFGFFVIPRYAGEMILRRRSPQGWQQVQRFGELASSRGITPGRQTSRAAGGAGRR